MVVGSRRPRGSGGRRCGCRRRGCSPRTWRRCRWRPGTRSEKENAMGVIKLARVYDQASAGDRPRFLVERLWPRGVRRADLQLDDWVKDVGPSTELRRWFGHEPEKWDEFRRRYFAELDSRPEAWEPLRDAADAGD